MREVSGEVGRQVATLMDRAANDLDSITSNPILVNHASTPEAKLDELTRLVNIYHLFTDITLYDSSGFVVGSTTPNHPGTRERSQWFLDALKGRKSVTSPFRALGHEGLFITVYLPLGNSTGQDRLVVAARMKYDQIWDLTDGVKLGIDGQVVLLDDRGNLLATRNKQDILTKLDESKQVTAWSTAPEGIYQDPNGKEHLYVALNLPPLATQVGRSWTLLCLEPLSEIEDILFSQRKIQAVIGLSALLLAYLLGMIVTRWLSTPLEQASESAAKISDGDLSIRMPVDGPVEMNRMAISFNKMLGEIVDHRQNLERMVNSRTKKLQATQLELQNERASLAERVEQRTRELRAVNDELARTAQLKDEFLAGMSHELRTPLNAILGLTESLEEGTYGALNSKQVNTLHTIDESGRHLLSLINDVLDVAKVGAGEFQLHIDTVDVEKLAHASLTMVKQAAMKKKLEIVFDFDERVREIQADERRLKQVLVNLLSNSVKFTPHGTVGLEVSADPSTKVIQFVVWDTGIGISNEEQEQLFQPFVQIDSSLARKFEGTGLGLTLVRNLTDLHGGSVSVSSTPNRGSRFTVTLPLDEDITIETAALANVEEPEKLNQDGHYILIVDDTESERERIASILSESNYRTRTANDGAQAIMQAREKRPEAIFMDVQMTGMDGIVATRHLRSDPDFEELPIIAMTSLGTEGDSKRYLTIGMTACLNKPASRGDILAALKQHVPDHTIIRINPSKAH